MDAPAHRSRIRAERRVRIFVVNMLLLMLPATAVAAVAPLSPSQSSWFVDMNRYALSAHAAFKCDDCHMTIGAGGSPHPDPSRPDFLTASAVRIYDYSQCRRCHAVAYDRYLTGAHAEALAKEQAAAPGAQEASATRTPAPTCGDCHASHYDRSQLGRLQTGRRMVETCGRCHPRQAASYLENIHGKAGVNLGNVASAFCTDCHGAHTVAALKTPEETLPACRRCHPNAETQFTSFVIHASLPGAPGEASAKTEAVVWIQRVRTAAVAVVVLSLLFFFGHSLLWLLRETHEKLRKH